MSLRVVELLLANLDGIIRHHGILSSNSSRIRRITLGEQGLGGIRSLRHLQGSRLRRGKDVSITSMDMSRTRRRRKEGPPTHPSTLMVTDINNGSISNRQQHQRRRRTILGVGMTPMVMDTSPTRRTHRRVSGAADITKVRVTTASSSSRLLKRSIAVPCSFSCNNAFFFILQCDIRVWENKFSIPKSAYDNSSFFYSHGSCNVSWLKRC